MEGLVTTENIEERDGNIKVTKEIKSLDLKSAFI